MVHESLMRLGSVTGVIALLLSAAGASFAAEDALPPRLFALVVGNNYPLDGHGYAALRYADDDAMRFAEFMMRLGADVRLLAGPDPETAERYPELAAKSRPPRRDALLDAIARLEADLKDAEGATREVYLYFSGHGSVTSSKAYLHLLDAPFTRTDLHALILERLSAERLHVIVDSCHSYFLVNDRGERVPAAPDPTDLRRYPRAGFLLSTSAKKEVQEWSGYEAGVFSYQLLGAMQGAADVDLDGKVTYAEAHAYIVAANLGIENRNARVLPFVHRPSVGNAVLVDLAGFDGAQKVKVPTQLAGHFHVVTGRGDRVLDANKPAGQPMLIVAPPRQQLLLWSGPQLYEVRTDGGTPGFTQTTSTTQTWPVATRGSVADELRRNLFRRPLTPEFVAGLDAAVTFSAGPALVTAAPRDGPEPVSIGLWTVGGAAIVAGGIATGIYVGARRDAQPSVFTADNLADVEAARSRADAARGVIVAGFSAGVALVGAGLLYEWSTGTSAPLSAGAGPGGVQVGGRW